MDLREHSTAAHALEGVGHVDKDSQPVLVETRLLPPLARVCGPEAQPRSYM